MARPQPGPCCRVFGRNAKSCSTSTSPTKQKWLELKDARDAKDLTPAGETAFAEVEKEQARIDKLLAQNDKDTRLVTEPGASDQALDEMVARRQVNTTVARTTDTTATGWQASSSGLTSSTTTVNSQVDQGQAAVKTTTSSTTIDSTGWSNKTTNSTKITDGEVSRIDSTTDTRKVDVSGGGLNYTSGTSSTSPEGEGTRTQGTSSTVGTSGYSSTTENSTVTDGTVDSTKSTSSFTRGDGKVGWSKSATEKKGTQDDSGALTKGTENTTTRSGGAVVGPDGVGAYGGTGKSYSQTRGSGVKTGQTLGLDGKVVANVTQVPDSDPAKYQVSITISLTGKVGGSGSYEKEPKVNDEKLGKGSVSGTVSGSLSGTATFVHIYDDAETQKYMAQVTSQGASGGPKELQIVEMLARGKLSDAKALMNNVSAAWTPDGALALKDGESTDVSIDLKGDAGLTLGGDSNGFGAKVSGSATAGGTLKRTMAKKGGKIVVTLSVITTTGHGLGGSASMEMAGGGYQANSATTQTESATFTLDPENHAYPEIFESLRSIATADGVRQARAAHAGLVTAYTTGDGNSSSGTTTATVGPLGLELTDKSSYDHATAVDDHGQKTESYTGAHGGGAAITGPAGFRVAHSETDTVAATVDSTGKASGDVSTTTTDTSWGASWDALKKSWSDNKLGLATGSAKVMQETTEVCGMKLSDTDFGTISAVAADPKRWQRVVESPRVYGAWMATGREIAAVNGDRQKIAKALATYGSENDGATHAIERIVRPAGSTDGGTLYDWPAELSSEKATYSSLITGDPLSAVKAKEETGDNKAALEAAKGAMTRIDALIASMRDKQDKFTDGNALGQMLAAAADRRAQVAKEIALLSHGPNGIQLPDANVTTVPTADQAAAKSEADTAAAKAELDGLIIAMKAFEVAQGREFVTVQKEDSSVFLNADLGVVAKALNELRDNIYPAWDKALTQARDAAVRAGLDPWQIQPVPGKGFFDDMYQGHFGKRLYTSAGKK